MPKIRVVNPDGVSGTIDSGQLADALNEGFKVAPEPESPSAGVNFLQNLTGATTGARSNQDVIQGATQGLPFMVKHPLDAGKMLLQSLAAAQQGTQQRALAQMKQPGIENKAAGALRGLYGLIPALGPMMEGAANQFDKGELSSGLGTSTGLAAILASAHPAAPETAMAALQTAKGAISKPRLPADLATAITDAVNPPPKQMPKFQKNVEDQVGNIKQFAAQSGKDITSRADLLDVVRNAATAKRTLYYDKILGPVKNVAVDVSDIKHYSGESALGVDVYRGGNPARPGSFFTESPDYASQYVGGQRKLLQQTIYPRRSLDLQTPAQAQVVADAMGVDRTKVMQGVAGIPEVAAARLRAQGYDWISVTNNLGENSGKVWISLKAGGEAIAPTGRMATLGQLDHRLTQINADLFPAYEKGGMAGQAALSGEARARLMSEAANIRSTLNATVAKRLGITPQEVAEARSDFGQLGAIADKLQLALNKERFYANQRAVMPPSMDLTLAGAAKGVMQMGGRKIFGSAPDRAVKSALKR